MDLTGQHKFKIVALVLLSAGLIKADQPCARCHAKEVAGYATSGMAKSLAPLNSGTVAPDGAFEQDFSKTKFVITGNKQSLSRADESAGQTAAFVIGSGNHAFGFLVQVGDHVFQSPLSYYTKRRMWDVAPGYEMDPHPDFNRPVTSECLSCHSGKPLPVAESLNRYQPGVFAAYGITCDRCHGDASEHLRNPVPGSILNPAKLNGAARSSICEQCHLTGETRIPNPGSSLIDFKPGHVLEDYYSTYVAAEASGQSIKVVSHVEQLALSKCARMSGDKLWCGTCHNPHDKPAQPAAYFRQRCLGCHAKTLAVAHAAPGRDCVACHMPQTPTSDGSHTAFTNHRIARQPEVHATTVQPDTLTAWRAPEVALRDRNLALALVAAGLQNGSAPELIRGYRLLNRVAKDFPDDPSLLATLGSVLMKGKQPAEALKCFNKAVALKPQYAPYYLNVAAALLAEKHPEEAARQAEKALRLDPLLGAAVDLLSSIYQDQHEPGKVNEPLVKFDEAMGISRH